MIVKILAPAKHFNGVKYNTNKIEKSNGELMLARNWGALQGISDLRPQDYVDYLKAFSSINSRIKTPQFHAVISAKGKEYNKFELCRIAEKWLDNMGYGDNPYLLVFHSDTQNNHIHLVSTRVGRDGKKISDSFEHKRAYEVLNKLTGLDETLTASNDMAAVFSYQFSTRAQVMLLLEGKGYTLIAAGDHYRLCKFGKEQARLDLKSIDERINAYQRDHLRFRQLRAIIEKYRGVYSSVLVPVAEKYPGRRSGKTPAYTSELSAALLEKFGLQMHFHAAAGKGPYGYTLIDHAAKTVYKGSDIIPLKELLADIKPSTEVTRLKQSSFGTVEPDLFEDHSSYQDGEVHEPVSLFQATYDLFHDLRLDIAGDVDDEQVHGRSRRRKKQSSTRKR